MTDKTVTTPEQIADDLAKKLCITEATCKGDIVRAIRRAWSAGQDTAFRESRITENYNDSREDVDRFNERTGGGIW